MSLLSEAKAPAWKIAFAMVIVYLIWGSTYLAIRFAIETLPPFAMAGARFLVAGVALYLFARAKGAPRPSAGEWKRTALLGALLLLGGNGLVVWAEQRIESGIAALLVATEPLWVVFLVWLRPGGRRPRTAVFAGLGLCLAGMALLVRPHGDGRLDTLGVAALIAATLSWAIGSVYAQRAKLPASPLLTTGMQMLAGSGLFFVASLLTGEPGRFHPEAVSLRSVGALAYLIVFGALIAYTAYVWLLRSAPPVLVSTYAYVNPVVAVLLGWALAGETLTRSMIGAAAIILTGVSIMTLASGSHGKPPEPEREALPAPEPEPRASRVEIAREPMALELFEPCA